MRGVTVRPGDAPIVCQARVVARLRGVGQGWVRRLGASFGTGCEGSGEVGGRFRYR